jgi:hypothetical protein
MRWDLRSVIFGYRRRMVERTAMELENQHKPSPRNRCYGISMPEDANRRKESARGKILPSLVPAQSSEMWWSDVTCSRRDDVARPPVFRSGRTEYGPVRGPRPLQG